MKTFKVADLLEQVNYALSNKEIPEDMKYGMCSLLEGILHATGNYKGFYYVDGWQGVETPKRFYMVENSLRQEYAKYEGLRKGGIR
jgi:NDP-sugar pyrophosphorylase family protein